jgi:hypothetical protein
MKATGNYASLVRGVSQQAPADRLEGQHGEQLNLISDPIRGLVRRNGLIIEKQQLQAASGDVGDAIADSFSYRTYSYESDDRDLDIVYRSRPKVGNTANNLAGLVVYDKTPDPLSGFLPVVSDVTDVNLAAYLDGGLSAITAVGSFVIMAGNQVAPSYTSADLMASGSYLTDFGIAWIRGGAYARTYTIKVTKKSTGVVYTGSYTTKTAMYDGTLDTSSVAYTDPDYQKQINDLTYAYNTAVNQWISDASADIAPHNIAQKLVDALTTAGWTGWNRTGSHITNNDVSHIEVTDGGDGSLLVSLLNSTASPDEVTELSVIGKIVKVQPQAAGDTAYYLKAYPKDGDPTATGMVPVIWREAAGVTQVPQVLFAIGVYHEGSFYVASTPTILAAKILAATGDTVVVPSWIAATVGDKASVVPPHFYGRTITSLSLFQDRLLIASDSTVNLSRPGDYFNFYRSSVLTVADDDPIEVYALGTEGDTIRQSAVYDKNLLLYGDKYHYTMSGKVAQTPATASIAVQYTIDNTAGARACRHRPIRVLSERGYAARRHSA